MEYHHHHRGGHPPQQQQYQQQQQQYNQHHHQQQQQQQQQHPGIPSSIMKAVSPINANVSIDSTLSSTNDSLSAETEMSYDHQQQQQQQQYHHQQQPPPMPLPLSPQQVSSPSYAASGIGDYDNQQQLHQQQTPMRATMDRDMTEDEVALMVRNALRKARKAMNNSASSSSASDNEDDGAVVDQQQQQEMLSPNSQMSHNGHHHHRNSSNNNNNSNDVSDGNVRMNGSNYGGDAGEEDDEAGGGGVGNNNGGGTYIPDEVSFGMSGEEQDKLPPLTSCDSEGPTEVLSPRSEAIAEAERKDALARRIEEEIRSARAFAERKYAAAGSSSLAMNSTQRGGGGGEQGVGLGVSGGDVTPRASPARASGRKSSSGRSSAFSVDTQMTPTISNMVDPSSPSRLTSASSPSSNNNINSSWRDTARKRMARTNNSNNNSNSAIRGATDTVVSNRVVEGVSSPNSTSGGGVGSGATSPRPPTTPRSSKYSTVVAGGGGGLGGENAMSSPRDGQSDNMNSTTSPRWGSSNHNLSNDPTIAEQEFTSNLPTPMATSSPSSSHHKMSSSVAPPPPPPPPPTTNTIKPHNSRQVLFRHPYPLPPPPPMPRNDDMIIASNCPPEKEVNVKWVQPDTDLEALIIAAGNEENLVRRSNACGALKVLASKDSNKPKLCRTTGLLDGLVKASWDDAVDSDALDARTRAVTTLLALSEPKGNRQIMAKHPQLIDVLIKVIKEDTGEARWRATSTLATLAKTPANRGGMGQLSELATVLGDLMLEGLSLVPPKDTKAEGSKAEASGGGGGDTEVLVDEEKHDDDGEGGNEGGDQAGGEGGGSVRANATGATGSRDDYSYLTGQHSTFDTLDDERLFTHTYSGTFTDGTGTTFTEDDYTYRSAYDSDTHYSDENEDDHSRGSHDSYDDDLDDDEYSVQDEEGVEMQISSLKKMNIENSSEYLAKSQLSACATLSHLAKHCANAPILCKNDQLLNSIITVAGAIDSPIHTRCLEILCNFTRFPSNNARLAAMPKCINALLLCCKSKIAEDRMWSVRTLQNLCSDASSKVGLATGAVLTALSTAAMRKDHDEQYAAVGALMNLSTEPGSIVPLTNTKTVVATLVHLAHSPNTSSAVRKLACDSLATIGLWLQTLASAGTVPPEIPFSPLPTHSATGWLRWE